MPSKDSVGSGRSRRFRAGTRRWTTALGAAAVAAVSVSGLVLGAGSAAAATGTTVSVTPSNLQGFDFAETRATGHYEFTADGLHIRTEGNTSTDKVAAYKPVSATLASVAAGPTPPWTTRTPRESSRATRWRSTRTETAASTDSSSASPTHME